MYDVVFVGAGITNLYCARNYLKNHPDANIVILEKSHKVGGRVAWGQFCGIEIVKGAGVGRVAKDNILLELLDELDIHYSVFKDGHKDKFIASLIQRLDSAHALHGETFRQFGIRVLGTELYTKFVQVCGFSDFEAYSPKIALKYYGFDDIYNSQGIFMFSWKQLIHRMKAGLNIMLKQNVTKIDKSTVYVDNTRFETRQVCLGITHDGLKHLLPHVDTYKYIGGQPFLRVYAKMEKPLPIKGYHVVDSPLQKVIPIYLSDHIYMIAYSDNASCNQVNKWTKRNFQNELARIFGGERKIERLVKYYWDIGTHYYKPGAKLSDIIYNPRPGVYVVGEAVARNQGWVGSALLTTQKINLS